MITRIRKTLQGNAVRVILFIIVGAFVFGMIAPFLFKNSGLAPWVAKVNGRNLSYHDFVLKARDHETRIRELRSQYGREFADMLLQAMGKSLNPKVIAVNELIRDDILNQLVQELGLSMHDEFVTAKLANPRFVYQNLSSLVPPQLISPKDGIIMGGLKNQLRRLGISLTDF